MGISSFVMVMSISLFVCGVVSMGIGVYILVSKVIGGDLKVIAEQTKKLGEKGISEDVAGLVGNASSLIDALNQLVKTTSGIGVFLIMIGFLLMLSAYYILLRLA
jgi:hypothetical protein